MVKKNLFDIFKFILVCFLIVGAFFGILYVYSCFEFNPQKVKDEATVSILEDSDPNQYSDIKNLMSEMITEETGNKPEKLAFILHESANHFYYVTIIYSQNDEVYECKLNWLNDKISNELDHKLINLNT